MSAKHSSSDASPSPAPDHSPAPAAGGGPSAADTAIITFVLEDPRALTGIDQAEWVVPAARGETILDIALNAGIHIEHACGGVCACSTCHVHVEQGMEALPEASEEEEDRVDQAPGVRRNSRLACQCEVLRTDVPIRVRVPGWNRNAVKETPH